MIRKNLQIVLLFTSFFGFAQVGVNTNQPKSTLDVHAKRSSDGSIEDKSKHIGIQAPRVSRLELTDTTATYGSDQTGAIIYITDVSAGTAAGARINIDTIGYYYFDGSVWQKMEGRNDNIYNVNGVLTSIRTLDYDDKTLNFGLGSKGQTITFGQVSGMVVKKPTNGTRSSLGLTSGGGTMWLYNDENSAAQIIANGTTRALNIGTSSSVSASPLQFITSPGGGALGQERLRIQGSGNIAIGGNLVSTEKLQINDGTVRIANLPVNGATNAINTTSTGTQSSSTNQTFNATRTVVANERGVLGYVEGLPQSLNITRVTLPTAAATLPANSSTNTTYTNISLEIPPGTYKLDISLGLTLNTISTYTEGSNFVRLRLADSESPVSIGTFSDDALYPRYVSAAFPFSQRQGILTGSLVVKNATTTSKKYYIHIDNASSNGSFQQVMVNNSWDESSLVYYPVTNN